MQRLHFEPKDFVEVLDPFESTPHFFWLKQEEALEEYALLIAEREPWLAPPNFLGLE
jgi:hypothetical protein